LESRDYEELLERVRGIANLLNNYSQPEEFRMLRCSAFVHDPAQPAFGLIYNFPPGAEHCIPRTLASIVKETQKFRERPCLEDRYTIARTIFVSIIEFHKVGWLHKSVSAHNVIFFTKPGSKAAGWLKEPYIVGLSYTRQDDPLTFSGGGDVNSKYHHPEYIMLGANRTRFQREFDYYSLGLVLLEIGLWSTIDDMTKAPSARQRHDELWTKRVPLLSHYMGTKYENAVRTCLDGFRTGGASDNETQLDLCYQIAQKLCLPSPNQP